MSNAFDGGVFLGGACNPTTWRKDTAIPALEEAGVPFYNPQVDDWHDGLVALEAAAKEDADVLLFVINGQTRGVASMVEAAFYIGQGRDVVLVLENVTEGDPAEVKDLNRGRTYLRDVANAEKV